MADSEKRGFFGRLFGGGKKETPESETTPEAEATRTEGKGPSEAPADADEAAQSVAAPETANEPGPHITDPVVMPVELSPALPLERAPEQEPRHVAQADADEEPAPEQNAADAPILELTPELEVDADTPETAASAPEALAPKPVDPEPVEQTPVDLLPEEPETPEPDIAEPDIAGPDIAEPIAAIPPADDVPAPRRSWFQRLRDGLSRSSSALGEGITSVFRKRKLDAETLEDLEDLLIQADLGADTALTITERLAEGRFDKEISEDEVRAVLAEEIEKVLEPVARPLDLDTGHKPHVVLLVGVNGTGKTTTIGKLAAKLTRDGKKVMLAAGDTFRAAAVEQLRIWGDRTGSPVIARPTGADAAGLVFDAMKEAKAAGSDVLLIDTAGRLQNRAELMAELEKVVRVIKKHDPEAPHTVLLTLDATTGQNAMSQVEIFGKTAGVTGLVMTKLDGTARGGILVAIAARHGLPVHFIGIGEGIDDLEPFTAKDFAAAIAGVVR
ncbi:signal recognition particle-docking protein FtsY [Breoghania sp. JC706]|uniref:signal recognition particle-docking protein FtsY n=1 Tax=Breoghania sp. JC706 TaxID=3117732 RepID=UPI003009E886